MCSFLVTNKKNFDLDNFCTKRMQLRGPDGITLSKVGNTTFVHSILHMTGEFTAQPLVKNLDRLVFNGEIYNYDKNYKSDGIFLLDNFKQLKNLDGEYGGVLYSLNNIFIFSDIFGTKPVFYSYEEGEYGISTFYSILKKLQFKNIKKLENNCILDLQNGFRVDVFNFNLDQYETNLELWEKMFLESVYKRYKLDKTFLCLSSGYDSGALSLACKILGIKVKFYTILNNEDKNIIEERKKILGDVTYVQVDKLKINKHSNLLNLFGDDFSFVNYDYKLDNASTGLSIIFEEAKKEGLNVNLSGAGADEVMSDYGIEGRDIFGNSSIKGIFPENLNGIFPWNNFFKNRQEWYLYKEECVAGIHGVESRYPYLDKNLVQGFLNLSNKTKNKNYKSPLTYLFDKYNFPYEKNVKRGFKCE